MVTLTKRLTISVFMMNIEKRKVQKPRKYVVFGLF